MSAKVGATIALKPKSRSAHAACSREEPQPKLAPATRTEAPAYSGASVLVAGANFGCGSSREHAPWALRDFGFKAIIAPSLADIFRANCYKTGLLAVTLPDSQVRHLIDLVN